MAEDPKTARHYWPLKCGLLNEIEYLSRQELIGDIQLILEGAIQSEMGISPNEFSNYSALLVISDLFDKSYVHEMTRMLFQDMGFSKLAFLQVFLSVTMLTSGICMCNVWSGSLCCLCFGYRCSNHDDCLCGRRRNHPRLTNKFKIWRRRYH